MPMQAKCGFIGVWLAMIDPKVTAVRSAPCSTSCLSSCSSHSHMGAFRTSPGALQWGYEHLWRLPDTIFPSFWTAAPHICHRPLWIRGMGEPVSCVPVKPSPWRWRRFLITRCMEKKLPNVCCLSVRDPVTCYWRWSSGHWQQWMHGMMMMRLCSFFFINV